MSGPPVVSASGSGDWAGRAAGALAAGAIVAHPTETLYGLAVDPWNEEATARLARLKSRGAAPGFILLAAAREEAERLLAPPPGPFVTLADRFWPGPLTLVATPGPSAPRGVLGTDSGLALRVTPDPVAAGIIVRLGRPLTSTSANRRGEAPPATAAEVASRLGDAIDLVVDGGPRRGGRPSTVVDLTGPVPVVLRVGAVPVEELRRALGAGAPLEIA